MSERSSPGHEGTQLRRGAWLPLPVALVAVAVTLPPPTASAQHRFDVTGSVALTETYDDNVFGATDDAREDVMTRLTPTLGAAYRSPRLTLLAQYAREAERFSRNPELTSLRARQEGTLDVRWSPGAGFAAAGHASYAQTHTPGQFNIITNFEITGLELRRSFAQRFLTTASLAQRLGARTRAVVEYSSTHDEIVGAVAIFNEVAAARLETRVGPVDALSVSYDRRRLRSAGGGAMPPLSTDMSDAPPTAAFQAPAAVSHAVTVTWAREVTPQAHLELKAGPRFAGERVRPELGATLRHRLRRGEAALAYVQTESAVIGHPAPVTARALGLTFTHSLRRSLTVAAGSSVFHGQGQALEAIAYGASLELTCRLSRYVSLVGTHRLGIQYGQVEGGPRREIVHNTALLKLVAGTVH